MNTSDNTTKTPFQTEWRDPNGNDEYQETGGARECNDIGERSKIGVKGMHRAIIDTITIIIRLKEIPVEEGI